MSDKKEGKKLQDGYQPKPSKEAWKELGYQPKGSQKPEGGNPPKGGSNVASPKESSAKKDSD